MHPCSPLSANYQFFECFVIPSLPQPPPSFFAPEKFNSPSHLCCFSIIFASRFSPFLCLVFVPLLPQLSPRLYFSRSDACQVNVPGDWAPSAQRQCSSEQGKGEEEGGCTLSWDKPEQNKMITAADGKALPAQTLALFNPTDGTGLMCPSQRDVACPATTLRQAFLLGMDSLFTSSLLFITLSHPGVFPSGKPSSRLHLQL